MLPDATKILLDYLRTHPLLDGVPIDPKLKAPPMLQVRRSGGIPKKRGDFLDSPRVMVTAWTDDDEPAAMTLARTAHAAIHEITSLATADGILGGIRDSLGFTPMDDPGTDYTLVRFEIQAVAHAVPA